VVVPDDRQVATIRRLRSSEGMDEFQICLYLGLKMSTVLLALGRRVREKKDGKTEKEQ